MTKTTVRTHSRILPSGRTTTVKTHTRGYKPADLRPFPNKKGIFKLPVRTAIIVPSTTSKSKKISQEAFDRRVEETRKFLSAINGGYTSVKAVGGYTDKDGRVIKEPVIVVESYAKRKAFMANKGRVRKWLELKGRSWGQESMGYEHEDDLYYVDSK